MINDILNYFLILGIYILVVFLPMCIYIRCKMSKNILKYLKLKDNYKKGIIIGTVISLLYISLLIIRAKINNNLNINLNLGSKWIAALMVGFLEEVPTRGFLLNKLQEKFPFIIANIIVTIIFVLLHFPVWIISGADIITSIFSIALVSLVFGYLVKEYKSLWITILCHSVFNICIWIGL